MKSADEVIAEGKNTVMMQLEQEFSSIVSNDLENKISDDLSEWETGLRQFLISDFPFQAERQKLRYAELDLKMNGASKESINEDLDHFKELYPEEDTSFWIDKCDNINRSKISARDLDKELESIRRNEQEAWRKTYEKMVSEWQIKRIQEEREKVLKKLRDWLKKIEDIKNALDELGIEPGILWDASIGTLCASDISFLKQWAEYLKNDPSVKKLCEMIGRMRDMQRSQKEEIIKTTTTYVTIVPNVSSKEEIIGIEFGKDLENLVPHELSLMADEEMSVLFDLKYVENRLMCFSKMGYSEMEEDEETEEVQSVDDKRSGPMIICVDTSGSMAGAPESVAKAITLSLSAKAVSQKRKCYLINFSTGIETMDLTPPKGMKELIYFLKMSFHGGTDVHPALSHGLSMMKTDDYEKADLLVISDFVMPSVSDHFMKSMNERRDKGCKFYSLSIGSFGTKTVGEKLFDKNWTYEPGSGSIALLSGIAEDIFDNKQTDTNPQ